MYKTLLTLFVTGIMLNTQAIASVKNGILKDGRYYSKYHELSVEIPKNFTHLIDHLDPLQDQTSTGHNLYFLPKFYDQLDGYEERIRPPNGELMLFEMDWIKVSEKSSIFNISIDNMVRNFKDVVKNIYPKTNSIKCNQIKVHGTNGQRCYAVTSEKPRVLIVATSYAQKSYIVNVWMTRELAAGQAAKPSEENMKQYGIFLNSIKVNPSVRLPIFDSDGNIKSWY